MQAVTSLLRSLVSGHRHRVVDEALGCDLDLSYITSQLIATSYPATGAEAFYRNSLEELARFLNARHADKYLVLNLSERAYATAALNSRVLEYGFPDHHAPPVEVAWRCCLTMHSWLRADATHVVVTHCLAGKGRTGVIICCYLLFSGALFEREGGEGGPALAGNPFSPPRSAASAPPPPPPQQQQQPFFTLPPPRALANRALGIFAKARGEGVKYASQKRMVLYFAQVIHATIVRENARLLALAEAGSGSSEGSGEGSAGAAPSGEGSAGAAPSGEGNAGAAPSTLPSAQLPAWDAAGAAAQTPASEEATMQCAWAAAEGVRSLRSIPLPASRAVRLLSAAVGGVPGLFDSPYLFCTLITSAPYQGGPRQAFYDSSKCSSREVAVEREFAWAGEGAGAEGGSGGGRAAAVAAAAAAAAVAAKGGCLR